MALSPKDLENSQVWLKEVNELEALIDEHLEEYYSGKGYPIPTLTVEAPRAIVQEKIVQLYKAAGWEVKFVPTDDAAQLCVVIAQK